MSIRFPSTGNYVIDESKAFGHFIFSEGLPWYDYNLYKHLFPYRLFAMGDSKSWSSFCPFNYFVEESIINELAMSLQFEMFEVRNHFHLWFQWHWVDSAKINPRPENHFRCLYFVQHILNSVFDFYFFNRIVVSVSNANCWKQPLNHDSM